MKAMLLFQKYSEATLFLLFVFLNSQLVFAQTDTPDCEQCYCIADNTPGSTELCGAGSDCRSYEFVAECTQNYRIKYVLTCTGESTCGECLACAYLTDEDGDVIWTHHNSCTVSDCSDSSNTITLTANARYSLWVCLRYCSNPNTSNCNDCVARAFVYHDWSDCSTIPACNP